MPLKSSKDPLNKKESSKDKDVGNSGSGTSSGNGKGGDGNSSGGAGGSGSGVGNGSGPNGSSPPDIDAESESEGPVSSFQSYAAEGDLLAKQGDYRKAIEAYTKALNMRPSEKNVLVSRSKCHLQLGDTNAALEDAKESLKEDPGFFKGVFQKAEALYAQGDFEMALVLYHRGNKLRPELDEFRLGIQKAREAIDNSIGNPRDYHFQAPAHLRSVAPSSTNGGTVGSVPSTSNVNTLSLNSSTTGSSGYAPSVLGLPTTAAAAATAGGSKSVQPIGLGAGVAGASGATGAAGVGVGSARAGGKDGGTDRTVKQLLGELYADKVYLEQLLNDRDFITHPNDDIHSLVSEALRYLDMRTEFWRQQKPIYARRKEHSHVQARNIAARNRRMIKEKGAAFKEREEVQREKMTFPKAAGGSAVVLARMDWRGKGGAVEEEKQEGEVQQKGAMLIHQPRRGRPASASKIKMVNAAMRNINTAFNNGNLDDALRLAQSLLYRVMEISEPLYRYRITADTLDILGNVYLEAKNLSLALQHFKKELNLSRERNISTTHHRALGNMARVYVKVHKYRDAANCFEEKLRLLNALGEEQQQQSRKEAAAKRQQMQEQMQQQQLQGQEAVDSVDVGGDEQGFDAAGGSYKSGYRSSRYKKGMQQDELGSNGDGGSSLNEGESAGPSAYGGLAAASGPVDRHRSQSRSRSRGPRNPASVDNEEDVFGNCGGAVAGEDAGAALARERERVWCLHDLGRCHLELGDNDRALEFGERCVDCAATIGDLKWVMNGHVLVAQARARKGELHHASQRFKLALNLAHDHGDSQLISSITSALQEIDRKRAADSHRHHHHHHHHHHHNHQHGHKSDVQGPKDAVAENAGAAGSRPLSSGSTGSISGNERVKSVGDIGNEKTTLPALRTTNGSASSQQKLGNTVRFSMKGSGAELKTESGRVEAF
ncbi:Tetratricopeptide repeat protein 25 [Quaeritorhiza haematococci]|nr:Tetratricopeptide repeat protein 25 [Quaeritorhiza haematococci]